MLHAIFIWAVLRSIPPTTVLVLAPGSSASGTTGTASTASTACTASIACAIPRVHRRLIHITDYLNKLLATDLEHKPLLPPSRFPPVLAAFLIATTANTATTTATTTAATAVGTAVGPGGDRSTKDTGVLLVDEVDGGLQVTCERLIKRRSVWVTVCQVSGLRSQLARAR